MNVFLPPDVIAPPVKLSADLSTSRSQKEITDDTRLHNLAYISLEVVISNTADAKASWSPTATLSPEPRPVHERHT